MRHPHASHNKSRRIAPQERISYKRGAQAVSERAVKHSIVVSERGHSIGLYQNQDSSPYDTPTDLSSLQPEMFASQVLSYLHEDKLDGRHPGKQLLRSIDEENDSETTKALKQLGAKVLGAEKNNADYQNIMTTLDLIMTADDLRDFITYLHEWSNDDATDTEQFVDTQMNELSGFRAEASFAKLARAAGFDFRAATRYEDHRGLDFMVEGVPFDIKSSERIAKYHTAKHKNDDYRYTAVKFVPPITADDFGGRLVLPDERVDHVLETTNFTAMVNRAIDRHKTSAA